MTDYSASYSGGGGGGSASAETTGLLQAPVALFEAPASLLDWGADIHVAEAG